MAKDATPSFIVALRLDTSCGDGMELDKALDAGRMLFNAGLGEACIGELDALFKFQDPLVRKSIVIKKRNRCSVQEGDFCLGITYPKFRTF